MGTIIGKSKHVGSICELEACTWLLRCGYEVFRNISSVGPIDIVAIKDGKIYLLDSKSTTNGKCLSKLTAEQVKAGVIPVHVFPSGACLLEPHPIPVQRGPVLLTCEQCGSEYTRNRRGRGRTLCDTCQHKDRQLKYGAKYGAQYQRDYRRRKALRRPAMATHTSNLG